MRLREYDILANRKGLQEAIEKVLRDLFAQKKARQVFNFDLESNQITKYPYNLNRCLEETPSKEEMTLSVVHKNDLFYFYNEMYRLQSFGLAYII